MSIQPLVAFNLPPLINLPDGTSIRSAKEWQARRAEILALLEREIYGATPEPCPVQGTVEQKNTDAYAGKAVSLSCRIALTTPGGEWSFPLSVHYPKCSRIEALFIHLAFGDAGPWKECPVEEILDGGFALASLGIGSVTRDDGDFSSGIASLYPRMPGSGWGKIGMWAYAASRVLDFLKTLEPLSAVPVAVIGHSRLGKTALWCGAQDERFGFVVANDSGCSGAAITRGKRGEHIDDITKNFPYWFCENYAQYADNEDALPFDQHFLLAACAPRKIYIGTAEEDIWADPDAEYLSCVAAGEAYRALDLAGFVAPREYPQAPAHFHDGDIGFHIRRGTHYLSRYDWKMAMAYILRHTEG